MTRTFRNRGPAASSAEPKPVAIIRARRDAAGVTSAPAIRQAAATEAPVGLAGDRGHIIAADGGEPVLVGERVAGRRQPIDNGQDPPTLAVGREGQVRIIDPNIRRVYSEDLCAINGEEGLRRVVGGVAVDVEGLLLRAARPDSERVRDREGAAPVRAPRFGDCTGWRWEEGRDKEEERELEKHA